MKAISIEKTGGPEVLQYQDHPIQEPQAKEVLIETEFAGINFIDLYFRTGVYPASCPFVLGKEGIGKIIKLGSDVRAFQTGQRVLFIAEHSGSYAEQTIADTASLIRVEDGIDPKVACALGIQGMTAHYLTHSTFPLRRGQKALIHAAAGGTGQLLSQVAKLLGAYVIATVSTEEKALIARKAGADEVIIYDQYRFRDAIEKQHGPRFIDVVYDSIGEATFAESLQCLKKRGMMVSFGQASGVVSPVQLSELSTQGSLFLTRPSLFDYMLSRDEIAKRASDLYAWTRSGQLQVTIDKIFPLHEAAHAHERLESRRALGKILLDTSVTQ